jgi:hypothetical protein
VDAAVVVDREPRPGVVEAGPAEKAPPLVLERDLHLRAGDSGQDEEHAQARLHRRLGRFGELDDAPQPRDALAPSPQDDLRAQIGEAHVAPAQGHVRHDDRLGQGRQARQVDHRAKRGWSRVCHAAS